MSWKCPQCEGETVLDQIDCKDFFADHYSYIQCANCKVYSISPLPTNEQLAKAYSEAYYGEKETKFIGPIEKWIDRLRFRKAQKVANAIPEGGKVLDIGCGNGRFLNYLAETRNVKAFGIEMEGKSAERAAKLPSVNMLLGSFEEMEVSESDFDFFSMIHVIEHLKYPYKAIEKGIGLLKSEASVYIAYPNIASRQAQKHQGAWLHLDPPRHLNFIPPEELISYMKSKGFELIFENHSSLEYNPYGEVQSRLNQKETQRDYLFEKLKGNKDVPGNSFGKTLKHFIQAAMLAPRAFWLNYRDAKQKKGACVEMYFSRV
jgi:2-polyprenyl-3-methyl-5-hydroxy-6-metoxy-1,4-benzoquinol methylase